MIDYHLHLVEHGSSRRFGAHDVRAYAAAAGERGVDEIAITEHLFRFPDVQDALGAWWTDDPDPRLHAQTVRYLAEERLDQSLSEYVEIVRTAAADRGEGEAIVRLGLEVDFFPGRMAEVVELLAPHSWDVLVGGVHWIGAFGFDQWGDEEIEDEWSRRDPDEVWLGYVSAVEELAASGACDVLAHVDLPKGGGIRPVAVGEACDERLVKAAAAHGVCIEISSAGWRKRIGEPYPAPGLLARFCAAGVGVTLASDGHTLDLVAHRIDDAAEVGRRAGYTELTRFEGRRAHRVPLAGEVG